ncbi:hypothetical protein DPMN_067894 [Dreissena polymorpha]|uniref:Uncharacterized protein n=1 Tax=Dreissena polymorpha TaxID=45954 RepID=A0A9D3YW37_DREPO|nr:hypothetical protein DPMN_067894 [Dreissena polymorpha]
MIEDRFWESFERFLEEKYKEDTDNCFADEISGVGDKEQNQIERLPYVQSLYEHLIDEKRDEEADHIYFSNYEAFERYMDGYEHQNMLIIGLEITGVDDKEQNLIERQPYVQSSYEHLIDEKRDEEADHIYFSDDEAFDEAYERYMDEYLYQHMLINEKPF